MSAIRKSFVLVVVFLGMFVNSARAQERVVVKVPFPFVVRGEEFPAGRYDITTEGRILSIRSDEGGSGMFALTLPADGHDPNGNEPALVFIRYENQYLLSQIWESSTDGVALMEESIVPQHEHAEARPGSGVVVTSGLLANWK